MAFETEAYALLDTMKYITPDVYTLVIGEAMGNAAMLVASGTPPPPPFPIIPLLTKYRPQAPWKLPPLKSHSPPHGRGVLRPLPVACHAGKM